MLPLTATSLRQGASHDNQVRHDDAPAYPAFAAVQSPIGAARQLHRAAHHTDPPFDSRSKALRFFEPPLPLIGLSFAGGTRLRQSHLPHSLFLDDTLIRRREHPTISRHGGGSMSEQLTVTLQRRGEPVFIGRIALSDPLPVYDDAAAHFGIADFVPKR